MTDELQNGAQWCDFRLPTGFGANVLGHPASYSVNDNASGWGVAALASIALSLNEIRRAMPTKSPTVGDIRSADSAERKHLLEAVPFVHVAGSVDVDNTVNVNVENIPLQVTR